MKTALFTTISFMILTIISIINPVFSEEDPFSGCPKYVGSLEKRGNVTSANMVLDILLNPEVDTRDSVVSTSFLKEKGKPADYYAPWKANDNNINTSWVEGRSNDGAREKLYLKVTGFLNDFRPFKIEMKIINGYATNSKLFKSNNRVKRAKLTVYEAKFDICGGYYSKRYGNVKLNKTKTILLKDSPDIQKFEIQINETKILKKLKKDTVHSPIIFMIEFEILDVYKGKKFNDTCISELNITNDAHKK